MNNLSPKTSKTIDYAELSHSIVPPQFIELLDCPVCKGSRASNTPLCETCTIALASLGALVPVVPISLYAKPSLLRDVLTFYKPGREVLEPGYRGALAYILNRFLTSHGTDLMNYLGRWTDVVVVPSTRHSGEHPLKEVASMAGIACSANVVKAVGGRGQHRVYDSSLFVASAPTESPKRILLIEDVYVTGARSQSCAKALSAVGTEVAGILALGRRINPEHDTISASHWIRHNESSPSLDRSHRWLRRSA